MILSQLMSRICLPRLASRPLSVIGRIQPERTFRWNVALICWLLIVCSGTSAAKPTLSAYMQQQLVMVRSLIEKESWTEAEKLLFKLKEKTSQSYAQALIAQSLGQIAIVRDDHQRALTYFRQAYDTGSLPKAQNQQLLHGIGQLHCSVEAWRLCQLTLSQWMQEVPEKVRAEDYIMLAQAYSMMEQWSKVPQPVNKALATRQKEGKTAPLSWHQLGVAAFIHLERWKRAVAHQQVLLKSYPNIGTEWRQLVSLHLQRKHYKSALATLRLGNHRGLLNTAADVRQLAELMGFNGLPYIAGKIIEQGLADGVLQTNARHLRLQANLWLQAREYEQAADVYTRLVNIDPKEKWVKQLAQLHITNQNWSEATRVLQSAVDLQADPKLNLLLGIAQTNQQQYEEARQSFEAASVDKALRPVVENWLQYLSQV